MPALDDPRRRRALYRAVHRGTKEMDWLLGRFAERHLDAMSETALAEFEILLSMPDPELQDWLTTGHGYAGSTLAPLIERIRAFHGLVPASGSEAARS